MLFDTSTWSLWPWGRRDQGHNCVSRVLSLFFPRGKERTLETRSAGTIIFHVRVWDRACWLIARKQIYLIGHKFMCMYVHKHNCVSRVLSLFLPRGKERTLETRSAETIIFHVRVWDRACWLIARKQIYLIGHNLCVCMYIYIYIYIYIYV